MKNQLLLLLFMGFAVAFGQETIYPLQTNPYLFQKKPIQSTERTTSFNLIDSTFIYNIDTLDTIPLRDDFAVSKFEPYDADYGDANVSSIWEYALLDGSTPLHVDSTYCDSTLARHDTVTVTEGVVEVFTSNFPTVQTVNVSDLCTYPVEYTTMELFRECYTLIDSVIDGVADPTQDTVFYAPQYEQDSANVFFVDVDNPSNIWVDNSACHNYRYAINPWSLGVVTFDGVDENGVPYEWGNPAAYGEADVLTSKHINLEPYSNVFISFLFQAKGHGNDPDPADSLLLDFWDVGTQAWYQSGWKTDGNVEPNQWDTVFLPVPLVFLDNGFRFRFRNYASTSAALDHWHIDYVNLQEVPGLTLGSFDDLAISYPVNTLLEDYVAVPWDHYKALADPTSKMLDVGSIEVYNSDNDATSFDTCEVNISHEGSLQANLELPNYASGDGWTGNWETGINSFPYDLATEYTFNSSVEPGPQTAFDIRVNIGENVGTGANKDLQNDTTYFQQRFDNYYQYDDGSAEAAYGLSGAFAQLAYEFEAYQVDTLTGILMHFMPWVEDLGTKIFLLTVWEDDGGQPGEIIYQDDFFEPHFPEYDGSKSGFKYYEFYNDEQTVLIPGDPKGRRGVVLTGTKFYVGWEQLDEQSLQIGLDWNIDHGDKVWRNTGGTWLQSSFECSLLIRPVFSTGLNPTLSAPDQEAVSEVSEVGMYPNPSTGNLSFSGTPDHFVTTVFDMSGRMVHQSSNETAIDLSHLNSGVYLVDLRDENGISLFSDKLIKQ